MAMQILRSPQDSLRFYPGWRFFLFFLLIVYVLWWHSPSFADSWENIWGFGLLLLLLYICLSFSIQVLLLTGQLARGELRHNLSLPRIFVPGALCLQNNSSPALILEVQLPSIFWGVQVFWELRLRETQTGREIYLRHRLHSGYNRINFPLNKAESWLLAQFQSGVYRGRCQCFYVRDFLAILHMRYRLKQNLELAILAPTGLLPHSLVAAANTSADPLSNTVHKFAQEGLGEQRPYYPGDDPRHINWKIYARCNQLYVRQPEERPVFSQDLHCYFVLDMSCYPKFLRLGVLDCACTYFLRHLKKMYRCGYRIIVHIPGRERGILYREDSEEHLFCLLAAYPRHACLAPNIAKSGAELQPVPTVLQSLLCHAKAECNNLVFASPHSISDPAAILSGYFAPGYTRYIPLPEPSASLRKELLQKRVAALLPWALLWRWLFLGREQLSADSRVLQLYGKLGLAVTELLASAQNEGKNRDKNFASSYQSLRAGRYPQLLLRLWAWQRYYRRPERRYPVGQNRRAD